MGAPDMYFCPASDLGPFVLLALRHKDEQTIWPVPLTTLPAYRLPAFDVTHPALASNRVFVSGYPHGRSSDS
jgi:hypothetical protein